jgi:hypothetical protein
LKNIKIKLFFSPEKWFILENRRGSVIAANIKAKFIKNDKPAGASNGCFWINDSNHQ